jgi:hypothetical protein
VYQDKDSDIKESILLSPLNLIPYITVIKMTHSPHIKDIFLLLLKQELQMQMKQVLLLGMIILSISTLIKKKAIELMHNLK